MSELPVNAFAAATGGRVFAWTPIYAVMRRELVGYFSTPVAYVFIAVFLALSGVFTFASELGGFFERGQADLRPFFAFHPWLYLFLIPAVTMRLWAEERRGGTIELLMTLPLSPWQAVTGKFLAAWAFVGVALGLTFPVWITVNMLGDPDNGVILAGYLGSLLMAGGFLAVGSCISVLTKNQVIAFVLSVVTCLGLLFLGFPVVQDALVGRVPSGVAETLAGMSFLTRFEAVARGVLEPADLLFFGALICVVLTANAILLELKKAD
jgi:ABC-2 type transport system permease protein